MRLSREPLPVSPLAMSITIPPDTLPAAVSNFSDPRFSLKLP